MEATMLNNIKKTLETLKPNDQLYEVRILAKGRSKRIISGYFKGTDNLAEAFSKVDLNGTNIFFTLNTINDACYSREQCERFVQTDLTTSDNDILRYDWLLVDIDPKRPSGISSTDAELNAAHTTAQRVYKFLKSKGFSDPVVGVSGNGMHLLYSVCLSNTRENQELIKSCLQALAFLFNDETVDIDTSVFNPARISKLFGTMAQKGSSTADRPHRLSQIIKVPDKIEFTDRRNLERLAAELPAEEKPAKMTARSRSQRTEFDLDSWLSEHGIEVAEVKQWHDTTKYILAECPFDHNHKAPDSMILKMDAGPIAFKCFHNSCTGRTWQDLRLMFEPDAYDNKDDEADERIEQGWKEYKAYNRNRDDIQYRALAVEEETEDEPVFETVLDILNKPEEERVSIPTGTTGIDEKIIGLAKGEISVVSGLRAAAKSTWLSQVALNAVDRGFNVLVYSGELKDTRFKNWLLCQAAGCENLTLSDRYPGQAWAKKEVQRPIAEWLGDHLHLYNNKYGNNFAKIGCKLREAIEKYKADLVIVDNMAILDLSSLSNGRYADKYDLQTLFVETLKDISIQCNCHVVFVAHPRKAPGFLRLDDISGSGNLSNLVDNAFIVHRNNEDFRRLTKEMYRWPDSHPAYSGSNVIEIVKDREYGNQDVFVPLWYEQYTRRMKNYQDEYRDYGWDVNNGFIQTADPLPEEDDEEDDRNIFFEAGYAN